MQFESFSIRGRTIWLVMGKISQTINVCTEANRRGDYAWKVRLPAGRALTSADLGMSASVDDLIRRLTTEFGGVVELAPDGSTGDRLELARPAAPLAERQRIARPTAVSDDEWIERARKITELCINELVLEFLDYPYLHRVEHSIHARLYALLRDQPLFDRHFPLQSGAAFTQPIQKEWPETKPRPDKDGRRGNFDLAILAPGQLNTASTMEFSVGQLAAPIVIEMGLNYRESHLVQDAEKLLNSTVRYGYLVHLVREQGHEQAVEATISRLRLEPSLRIAYARVAAGQRSFKLLEAQAITHL